MPHILLASGRMSIARVSGILTHTELPLAITDFLLDTIPERPFPLWTPGGVMVRPIVMEERRKVAVGE